MIDEKDLPKELQGLDMDDDDKESAFHDDGSDDSDESFESEDQKKSKKSAKQSKPAKKGKGGPRAKKGGKEVSVEKTAKGKKAEKPPKKGGKKAATKDEPKAVVKPKEKDSKKSKVEEEEPEDEPDISDGEDDGDDDGPTAEGDKGVILNYLKSTNRPYSLINIFDNHHGKIKKKALEKILESLEEEKAIVGKIYGKAKIYFYNQIHHPELDQTIVDEAKATLEEFRVKNKELVATIRELKTEASKLDRMADIGELKNQIDQLKEQIDKTTKQLENYKAGGVKLVSDDDIKRIESERDKVSIELKKRSKMLRDIIDTICEGTEQKADKVRKMMGID